MSWPPAPSPQLRDCPWKPCRLEWRGLAVSHTAWNTCVPGEAQTGTTTRSQLPQSGLWQPSARLMSPWCYWLEADKNLPWDDFIKLVHERVGHLILFGECMPARG